ncbi:MAG TPA: NfeD family protein [Egibacteraceae bacterium]|nr:NfeD family protein [Egibacteraceae bacterium]
MRTGKWLAAWGGGLLAAALVGLVGLAPATGAERQPSVLSTRADGPITPIIADHLTDAVAAAADGGHGALLVELDTPGGLDTAMRRIVQDFLAAPVPVVVYVSPAGARAASAGAVIAFSAHVAAMAPGTNIGAATPVDLEGGQVLDKVVEDAAAYVAAVAEERDRNVDFAVDAVREGRSAPASEAVEIGVADLMAAGRGELLDALDGRTVALASGDEVRLRTAGAAVVDYEMSPTRRLLQTLADPNLAFLLLSLGTLAVLYELANPGAGIGGALGAVMLVLAFVSLSVLPVNLAGVLLLVLAIALFIAELFVPGVGALAGGGALTLAFAGLLLFQRPTGVVVDPAYLLPVPAALAVAAAVIGRAAWRSRRAPPLPGSGDALVGAHGTVRHAEEDAGQVFVSGALWKARSRTGQALTVGRAVRVIDREGLTLVVEHDEPGGQPPPPQQPRGQDGDEAIGPRTRRRVRRRH